ncbi:MAG: hypothetical protein GWO20_10860 [Candidatus Korarchaeota archaeon]|nr:hypothetical protein [Candidatus Korarchaeota archaeon]NIU83974.1 hypothetical protein [Candidatus Thorarchaeota archaeon]NIW14098.1 hypothetical protein [Candidatus Thorarchaeota archaeon]NIW52208.1 hypothetical protein [Candidatus Korarchaeota archaeon]
MNETKEQKLNPLTADLWGLLMNKQQIKLAELYEIFEKRGEQEKNIQKAIEILQELSMIKGSNGKGSGDLLVKVQNVIGKEIEDLPCLGCQALEKCGVGENYSPENCNRLSLWIRDLRKKRQQKENED